MICKYVPKVALAKLNLAEATLKWCHKAPVPVAPDTLWCGHLFITIDSLIMDYGRLGYTSYTCDWV